MNHFILYPFWINEVACWSDLKFLNGPVGTENRGVAVFTHRDTTQLIESTFTKSHNITKSNGRDCCTKFATGLNIIISHSSKNI